MGFDFGAGAGGKKPKKSFIGKAQGVADPLAGVEYTGNVEVDSARELEAFKDHGIDQRRKDEDKRFRQATDSEYWFAVCFEDRAQKEAFLAALPNARQIGDKYIDGKALAKAMGIDLAP